MDFKDVPLKDVPTQILIKRLAAGWSASQAGLAQEFVQRWGTALKAHVDIEEAKDNTLFFVTCLNDICMQGMRNVPCRLVSGDADMSGAINELWEKTGGSDHFPIILTFSNTTYTQVMATPSKGHCVRLSGEQVWELLKDHDPQEALKRFVWKQIPKRALIPYNILLPAEGGMFFGRENEVARLLEENLTSFAIAGPGRIGKTSLLRRYKEKSLHSHAHQSKTRFIINLYTATPATTARFLAMRIDPNRRSDRIDANDLVDFFLYQKKRLGAPLELLLDEVDEVCQSQAFQNLAEAAKRGLCRLVLCGRGVLLKAMLSPKSPLENRLELIRVEPLDEPSARKLILKPLTDLGFIINQRERILEQVLSLTGRLPNLIQYLGKELAVEAIKEKSETISPEHLQKVKDNFMTAEIFIESLIGLEDPKTRLVGLCLIGSDHQNFTIQSVQEVANKENLKLDVNMVHEICNNLVIHNVLSWNNGSYTIANEGLPFYARQIGYLDGAQADARKAVKARA